MLAPDAFCQYYAAFLQGTYDCVDRIVLNGYFRLGCSPGGFRTWWRAVYGTDANLDNAHLIRLAGRFSRRIHGWAAKHKIPVIKCTARERPHEVVEEACPVKPERAGVFCIVVKRAPYPIWEVRRFGHGGIDIKQKAPAPYVNHYAFHVLDKDWGHMVFKICGHPPFTVQIMVNGHEYVAKQARKKRLQFTKEDNCFTSIANAAGLQKVAETSRSLDAIGRLKRACEHWLSKVCVCLALDVSEQKRSGFHYTFSQYQAEYSRNLLFRDGAVLEKVFQGVIDRTRARLDVRTLKTIFGRRQRGARELRWEVVVERPSYDLTVFKIHCGIMTLKMYSKGEHVLRIEAIVHNVRKLALRRGLEYFPQLVEHLQGNLQRFMEVVSCLDVACLDGRTWEELPLPSQVGKTRIGGVDVNKPRVCAVLQAIVALAVPSEGFGSVAIAAKVRELLGWPEEKYQPRHASYDLKKLRGKNLIQKIGARRYHATGQNLRTIAALAILRDKVIQPILSKATKATLREKPHHAGPIEEHYAAVQKEFRSLLQAIGIAA